MSRQYSLWLIPAHFVGAILERADYDNGNGIIRAFELKHYFYWYPTVYYQSAFYSIGYHQWEIKAEHCDVLAVFCLFLPSSIFTCSLSLNSARSLWLVFSPYIYFFKKHAAFQNNFSQ